MYVIIFTHLFSMDWSKVVMTRKMTCHLFGLILKPFQKQAQWYKNYENRASLFHFIGNQKFELMTSQRRVIIKKDLQKRGFFQFFRNCIIEFI